jgi:hypothetical protein
VVVQEAGVVDRGRCHETMAELHARAVVQAEAEDTAMIFLSPDTLFSNGSFASLARWVESDPDLQAVMIASPRLSKGTFLAEHGRAAAAAGPLGARALVGLALRHLHPISRSLCWSASAFNAWPSHLYWPVGDDALLARCFHLHPLWLRPARRGARLQGTVDDGFVAATCEPERVRVVVDSDEIACFEASDDHKEWHSSGGARTASVASWAARHADALHRSHVRRRIWFHAGDRTAAWERAEVESDAVVAAVS